MAYKMLIVMDTLQHVGYHILWDTSMQVQLSHQLNYPELLDALKHRLKTIT